MRKVVSILLILAIASMCLIASVSAEDPITIPKVSGQVFVQDPTAGTTTPTAALDNVAWREMANKVNGTTDTTAKVKIAYDETSLYFYLEIVDKTQHNGDALSFIIGKEGAEYGADAALYSGNLAVADSGWIPGGGDGFAPQGGSMTLGTGCMYNVSRDDATNTYKVCVKATLNDSMQTLLVPDSKLKLDVIYHDGEDWNQRNNANNLRLFSNTNDQGTTTASCAVVTLVKEPFAASAGVAVKGTPSVDRKKEAAWDEVPAYKLTRKIVGAFGFEEITAEVEFRMMWDELGLYVYAEVTDPTPNVTAGDLDIANNPYQADCLDIYINQDISGIDPNVKTGFANHPAGFFQITGAGNYTGALGGNGMTGTPTKLMSKMTDTGYVFECFVKWTEPDKMVEGAKIGVDIGYNDNMKGTGRTGMAFWSCDDGMAFQEIQKFGVVTLEDHGLIIDNTVRPEEATEGTQVPTASDVKSDSVTLSWKEFADAASYNINVFEVGEAGGEKTYTFVNTEGPIYDEVSETLYGLNAEKQYAFQVIACDVQEAEIAYYPLVEIKTPAGSANGGNNGNTGSEDDGPKVPETGVEAYAMMAAVLLLLSAGCVISLKKRSR